MRRLWIFSTIGLGLLLSCSKDTEPPDTIPPAAPLIALVRAAGPVAGSIVVTGQPGAVEANSRVEASNQNGSGIPSVTVPVAGDGSFSLSIAGEFLDPIKLFAIDEANNRSNSYTTVISGAPFQAIAISGGGQEAEVTQALPEPLVFRVLDGDGQAVPGIIVEFLLAEGIGDLAPGSATSDANGEVETALSFDTLAGPVVVMPAWHANNDWNLSFTTVETITARALPGPPVELVWDHGVGQKDGPGYTLLEPLVAKVQDAHGNGVPGQSVQFQAESGSAAPSAAVTDSLGRAQTIWTLGGAMGEQWIRAAADGLDEIRGEAVADEPPILDELGPGDGVDRGDLLIAYGANFCDSMQYNELRIGDISLEMVQANESQVKGRVPMDIFPGLYEVTLTVGHQTAVNVLSIEVYLPLGQVEDYPFGTSGTDIEILFPSASTRYALIPYNLELGGDYPLADDYRIEDGAPVLPRDRGGAADFGWDFHRRLLEYRPAMVPGGTPPQPRSGQPRDVVEFWCLANPEVSGNGMLDTANYERVTASLEFSSQNVLIYVDSATNVAASYGRQIDELGAEFDLTIYPTDTAAFGDPTDRDSNGRVIVLLTKVVNLMTPVGSQGYIGGFFNPIDLDIGDYYYPPSNHGEIFYTIVPDPTGAYGVPHHPETTFPNLAGIIAHEFQHLINTGQRHIIYPGNAAQEELWLNEGLSHLAEDLCGYERMNAARVELYLHSQHHTLTSLTVWERNSELASRGAAYLFCRYLQDRWENVSRQLVAGPAAGPANVTNATGTSFDQCFKDWAAAIFLDGRDLGVVMDPIYQFESHDIRSDFPYDGGPSEPLSMPTLMIHELDYANTLPQSSLEYLYLEVEDGLSPPAGNKVRLHIDSSTGHDMGLMLVRIQR